MTLQERLSENPDDYVKFKTKDGDVLQISAAIVDSWTPAQRRWAEAARPVRYSPHVERVCKLAYESYYYAKHGVKLLEVLPISPRTINRFQFWLRMNLTQLGLI